MIKKDVSGTMMVYGGIHMRSNESLMRVMVVSKALFLERAIRGRGSIRGKGGGGERSVMMRMRSGNMISLLLIRQVFGLFIYSGPVQSMVIVVPFSLSI
jgi:hypothetical protein